MKLRFEVFIKGIGSVHGHGEQPWAYLDWAIADSWRTEVNRKPHLPEHVDGKHSVAASGKVDCRGRGNG
jgi:hypothetical protein